MGNDAGGPATTLACRPAVKADLPAIVALLNDDVFGQSRNPLYADAAADYERAFAVLEGNGENTIIVATTAQGGDAPLVGCYQLTFIRGLSHRGALRAQVESVRIAAAVRGCGYGSALMRDAIERARARGATLVQLTTDMRRPETRRFYERLGFSATHHGMKRTL